MGAWQGPGLVDRSFLSIDQLGDRSFLSFLVRVVMHLPVRNSKGNHLQLSALSSQLLAFLIPRLFLYY